MLRFQPIHRAITDGDQFDEKPVDDDGNQKSMSDTRSSDELEPCERMNDSARPAEKRGFQDDVFSLWRELIEKKIITQID